MTGRVGRWRALAVGAGALALLIALNVVLYLAPIDYRALGDFAYAGAFLITLLANATTVVPVPYVGVVARIVASVDSVPLVVLSAALGSVLGESVAFFVGRAEEGVVADRPIYRRLHKLVDRPLRAGLFLFVFAVPFNPLFDVAGLAAGALGLSYRIFFLSVFLARIVRFALIASLGAGLGA